MLRLHLGEDKVLGFSPSLAPRAMVTLILSEEAGVHGARMMCGYRVQREHEASGGEIKGELTKCTLFYFYSPFFVIKGQNT